MDIKEKIIEKLDEKGFPDLKYFSSEEVLVNAISVLEELLEKEKKDFAEFLAKKNEDLVFEDLEDDSLLDYFWSILNHFENVESKDELRKIIEEFMPKLQDFWNEIAYSKPYFEKLVYMDENLELDDEQRRILYLAIKAYKDRWIDLPLESQERIKEINKKLWELSDKFSNNIVDSKKQFEYIITDFEIIKDLPKDVWEVTKNAYKSKFWDEKEWYLFNSDPNASAAIMKYCSDRNVRKDFEFANYTYASTWEFDNRPIILEILKLKEEKAKILWFKNYAELSLNSKMAENPEQIFDLIKWTLDKAKTKAEKEIKELEEHFHWNKFETYDLAYYTRKLKEEKYDVDEQEVKKYFEFENVLDYLFKFVENFYWIKIKKIAIESYNDDIRVYEIYKDNKLISYYFLDAFFRNWKRPWAWADSMRSKTFMKKNWKTVEKVPVVLNVCNFLKADSWKTTIYMWDAETLFHEFGHALHEMLSESRYSGLSGFNVEWDFVELPSQLMENWVWNKESLKKLWKHFESWESFPEELIKKFEALKTFMTWNFVARQNEFALLDMTLYSQKAPENIEELDKNVLEIVNKYWLRKRKEDYKMYCSFSHIFGWGYAAWYYSYMWAEILEADVFAKIKEMWMFSPETWNKLLKSIIWQWTRKDADKLFFDFMWREVDNKAFMERYWI